MIDLESTPRKADSYCERQLGEETIFLSPKGDEIHALDEVGTFIWKQLDAGVTLSNVLDRMCDEYDVPRQDAERDLLAFVGELIERRLLTVGA